LELLGHITEMVGDVKSAALEMAQHVGQQNVVLDQIAEAATGNMEELHAQREKMKSAIEDMSSSTWTTLGTLAWLLGMFFMSYGIIRLFPR
jgi:methyl-accepting chemotaxis protein